MRTEDIVELNPYAVDVRYADDWREPQLSDAKEPFFWHTKSGTRFDAECHLQRWGSSLAFSMSVFRLGPSAPEGMPACGAAASALPVDACARHSRRCVRRENQFLNRILQREFINPCQASAVRHAWFWRRT